MSHEVRELMPRTTSWFISKVEKVLNSKGVKQAIVKFYAFESIDTPSSIQQTEIINFFTNKGLKAVCEEVNDDLGILIYWRIEVTK